MRTAPLPPQPCLPAASAQSQLFTVPASVLSGSPGPVTHTASGKCLDIPNESPVPGNPLDLWACNGGSNQDWALQAAKGSAGSLLVSGMDSACAGVCQ